jgi:hypothetical protein
MSARSIREKSIWKTKLLRDPLVSAAFGHYFQRDWPAQQILDGLRSTGADIERLREWALYSFHPLGKDEAEEKRQRGLMMRTQLKKALVGYENAIAFYWIYASAPDFNWPESIAMSKRFKHLLELNRHLEREARSILERAATNDLYKTKRLGVFWQSAYLFLSRSYIGRLTNWNERKILGAMTHLIAASHKSVRNRVPKNLRTLIRKALREFEGNPRNARIIERLRKADADAKVVSEMFPPLITNPS